MSSQPNQTSKQASDVTKMTFVNGTLLHSGTPAPAVCHLEALVDFLEFLRQYKPCILVAHNCRV